MNHTLSTAHTLSDIVLTGDGLEPGAPDPQARYLVDFVSDLETFNAFRRPVEELASTALEPSLAAGFAWSKATLTHIASNAANGGIALVWRYCEEVPGNALKLVGSFTQSRSRTVPGLPLEQVSTWNHVFNFSGTPLVHRDYAASVFEAYLGWALNGETGASGLFLDGFPADGPLAQAFDAAVAGMDLKIHTLSTSERAVLEVPDSLDAYLNDNLPRKKRKEFRRLHARLREQGELAFSTFQKGDDLSRWLADFYALEGRGWKGRAGTALTCDPAWSGFFDDAMGELAQAGEAQLWKLTLDGAPVAMVLAGRNGRHLWLFKIAFDEDYARYSPGVLIILEIMRQLSEAGATDIADSCAQPDHPMINSLWRERLGLRSIMVAPNGPKSAIQLLLTRTKRQGRKTLKRLYKRYIKGGAK